MHWLRALIRAAVLLLLLAVAYAPLHRSGFVGTDFRVLAEAASVERVSWDELYRLGGEGGSLLVGAWTIGSERLWGAAGEGPFGAEKPLTYRVENLLVLWLAALGLAFFVRRLLIPWMGSDQAHAAGRTTLALYALHPLCSGVVAGLAARADLLAMAFATWSAAAFLRGRQDRRFGLTVVAGALAVLASLSGELALGLPLVLAAAELLSAHRYRTRRERVRTTLTTLVVYGACVAVDLLLRRALSGAWEQPIVLSTLISLGSLRGFFDVLLHSVEKLGVLVLPVNAWGGGLPGIGLAGLLFLAAMQPALVAARSAPRLWGWLLFGWFVAVLSTEFSGAPLAVRPVDFTHSATLFASAAVMSIGLGVAATAVSDARRAWLPLALCAGYALLAYGNSRPLRRVAQEVQALRVDLAAAIEQHGIGAEVLIVDPPGRVDGVDCLGDALPHLLDATFAPGVSAPRRAPRGLTREAFLALACEPELAELRRGTLVVLVREDALLEPGLASSTGMRPRYQAVRLLPPEPTTKVKSWRGESRSPDLDVEALSVGALRVSAGEATNTGKPQIASWRARKPTQRDYSHPGAWLRSGDQPIAIFDLSASLSWRLGGRIRRIWFESGLPAIELAELLDELPGFVGAQVVPEPAGRRGRDWVLRVPRAGAVQSSGERGTFSLALFDLATLERAERDVDSVRRDGDNLLVRVRDAGRQVERALATSGGPLVWTLDYRTDGLCVARARGRIDALQRVD